MLLLALLLSLPLGAVELRYSQISERPQIVDIRHAGDGSQRLFLVEQAGRIWIWRAGNELETPFLDIRDQVRAGGERGLLSLAFAPDYDESGAFYLWYTNSAGDTVLARWRAGADPDRADPESEEVLLTVRQPFGNHNGGQLQFGPDGFLYLSIGDGGGGGDPEEAGQDLEQLLGSVIRLDVDPTLDGYGVPADNPFVGQPGRDEIWAWGLRNPWRMAFDSLTGDLFIADVGQNDYEEVNVQGALAGGGQNYGWNLMEGFECFTPNCDTTGLVLPVGGYDHDVGCSITGGVVYRGTAYPELFGRYLFGDFCTGRLWSLVRVDGAWQQEQLDDSSFSILTFGSGEDGSVYLSASGRGVYRLSDGAARDEQPFTLNAGLNDAWFNPETAGQGVFINVFPDQALLFLSWFTFDLESPAPETPATIGAADQRWFTAVGPLDSSGADLTLSVTEGGVFDQSGGTTTREVGTLRLEFAHCNSAVMTYRFDDDGPVGQVPLVRVVPEGVSLCEALSDPEG
ncbi:MAG: PQQ-dependent sugar dehydrogenase [Pseudomonadota bacterium]